MRDGARLVRAAGLRAASLLTGTARHAAWRALDVAAFLRLSVEGFLAVRNEDQDAPPGPGLVVVLVPGIYETASFMEPLARAIRAHGYQTRLVRTLGLNHGPVPEMARRLAGYLRRLGAQRVAVVGHSKGGLIGKYVMVAADPPVPLDGLVAINTPFGGSPYARWVPFRALRAFAPGAPVLRTLAANWAANSRITSVWSTFDPHIPVGCELAGARNVEIDVPGHFNLLRSRELLDVVLASLADIDARGRAAEARRDARA